MNKSLRDRVRSLPESLGVYVFKSKSGQVIYVGKAKNLKARVASYALVGLEPKTSQMVSSADKLDYLKVETEVEALLLEAEMVRIYKPKYNIQLKDDKTPIYIGIIKEEFPRIILIRKTQLESYKFRKLFGPFVNAPVARKILKRIRKVFPYATHGIGKRPCLYSQLGLCNPCPNVVKTKAEKSEYLKNIKKIEETLSGKITKVRRDLEKQMKALSGRAAYELAKETHDQIKEMDLFTHSFDRTEEYLANPNLLADIRGQELSELYNILKQRLPSLKHLRTIECYDAAHLGGAYPAASRVTFVDGEPDKSFYRRYRIPESFRDDTSRLKNVFARRLKSGSLPDLIIVDGGKPQVSAASQIFGSDFPLAGLAKRYETLVFYKKGSFAEVRLKDSPAKRLIQRLRDEAHRFAQKYHHKLVAKGLTNS